MKQRPQPRALLVAALLSSMAAFADAQITVDGQPPDWAQTTTCYNEAFGDQKGNIDLVRVCLENDNAGGDVGSLYAIFENKSSSISEAQFGLSIDVNADGVLDGQDEFWHVNIPSGGDTPQEIYVRNPVTLELKRSYLRGSCGGTSTSDGWSATRRDKYVELGIAYGCLGLSYANDARLVQAGCHPNLDLTTASYYDGTNNTLTEQGAPPNVGFFTLVSGPAKNTLTWNNPPAHQGVVILRREGLPVETAPTPGTTYAVGASVGTALVVYADGAGTSISGVNSWTDTDVVQPTDTTAAPKYYYKVFNHHQNRTYAAGNVPTSSGLWGEPTRVTRPAGWEGPHWCYNTGFSSYVQPAIRRGVAAFAASNLAAVTGNVVGDGLERYRPRRLLGAVQDRYTVAATGGFNGLFTGDQSGRLSALSSDTGATIWTANNGPLASSIQSTPVFQARAFSDPAFQAAYATDLVFAASRNPNPTNNRVFAVRTDSGAVAWTGPKNADGALLNMDIVSGAPWAEYDATGKNRLWVGSRTNGGAQPGLWVLSSLDGTVIKTFAMPAGVDLPVFRDNTLKHMVVVDNAGVVHGIDLATLSEVWSVNIGGPPASFPYTIGGGFIITKKGGAGSGTLARYRVVNNSPSLVWSVVVADPSFPSIDFTPGAQRIYVGSSDGAVRAYDPSFGTLLGTLQASSTQVGTPSIDSSAQRLTVYGADGRLCSFSIPFN